MGRKKQGSLRENTGMEDLKLVNDHVYRRTTPSAIRATSQGAYVFSAHIVAATKSHGTRITGADPGRFHVGRPRIIICD